MEKLALLGGPKAVTLDYEKLGNRPIVPEKAYKKVEELMRKGEISSSPLVTSFEKRFADYTGAAYGLALSNGTSAIMAGLYALGVGPGDEVLVPSYTFWASAGPIVACNAIPVFCDIDPRTHCIAPEEIEARITSRTKAVVVVHVWGNPADMDAIMAIAGRHGIQVLEDCSHAHGAMYKGKRVGSIGHVGCFSFQGSKTLPAGEGGILVTNSRSIYEKAASLGSYERLCTFGEDSQVRRYALTGMGYKFRIHPLAVAIADAGLDELEERNQIRNDNGRYFEAGIADLDCFVPQQVLKGCEREYAYHYMFFDNQKLCGISTNTLLTALSQEGVVCGTCGYGRLHQAPLYTEGGPWGKLGCPFDCPHGPGSYLPTEELPVSEFFAEYTFMAAPRFENPCKELIEQYIAAYHKIAASGEALRQYEKDHGQEDASLPVTGRSINLFQPKPSAK